MGIVDSGWEEECGIWGPGEGTEKIPQLDGIHNISSMLDGEGGDSREDKEKEERNCDDEKDLRVEQDEEEKIKKDETALSNDSRLPKTFTGMKFPSYKSTTETTENLLDTFYVELKLFCIVLC